MTLGRRTTAVAVGATVLALVCGARYITSRRHERHLDEQIRRDMHAKAQALKDEIDHLLPAGTPRVRFMEFARKRAGWQADAGDDHYISIGQEPSRVWYCGPWEVGVLARFKDDRLTVTEVSSWGLNCP